MRTREQQREAAIRDLGLGRRRLHSLGQEPELRGARLAGGSAARPIRQPAPGDGHQPSLGVRWAAAARPVRERGGEGLGEGVFGGGDVTSPRGQEGHQPAIAAARHCLRRATRGGVAGVFRHAGA
jgi:hypothetical protein